MSFLQIKSYHYDKYDGEDTEDNVMKMMILAQGPVNHDGFNLTAALHKDLLQ